MPDPLDQEHPAHEFDSSAEACAERARKLMAKGDFSSDIYAAVEIRWGTEAKLKDYVAATESIPKSQRKNWEVAKLGRSLETAYRAGDKMMVFTFQTADGHASTLLYTPVVKRLRDIVERLGQFIHAPAIGATVDAAWRRTLREHLDEALPLLLLACQGQLLGMPLMHKETRRLHVRVRIAEGDPRLAALRAQLDANVKIDIAYIDPIPGSFAYYPKLD